MHVYIRKYVCVYVYVHVPVCVRLKGKLAWPGSVVVLTWKEVQGKESLLTATQFTMKRVFV